MNTLIATVSLQSDVPYLIPARQLAGIPAQTYTLVNNNNLYPPCENYQHILEFSQSGLAPEDIICYLHDDLEIHEQDWLNRVLAEFQDPHVAVVGFGGAKRLGHPDLYKKPYDIWQLARAGYRSNQRDWQVHGERETGVCTVAVVDAFAMVVRTEFLAELGGWPVHHITHHCLDLWLCCEAARRKRKVQVVGIDCTHHGGGTSTKESYVKAGWLQGGSIEEDHRRPHKWLYDSYKDVLPICV